MSSYNRRNRRDRRTHKQIDAGTRTLRTMPWKTAETFGSINDILNSIVTTGDIDDENGKPVFKAPSSHAWFELAPAIEGVAEFYELHAQISGRDMPTAPLRQLANKFRYEMMIFPSDVDAVRECLVLLKSETLDMTLDYATSINRTIQEAA